MKVRLQKLFVLSLLTGIVFFGFEMPKTFTVNKTTLANVEAHYNVNYRISSLHGSVRTVNITNRRCGSSFFGGLFDMAPQSFYIYEPLDSLYNAMYGTAEGWNVPSDIMNYKNGTVRIIPESELREVAGFLANLLQCKLDALPLEFFLHTFWRQFAIYQRSIRHFKHCIVKQWLYKSRSRCYGAINSTCPRRFGVDSASTQGCHENLSQIKPNQSFDERRQTFKHLKPFLKYSSCMESYKFRVGKCIEILNDVCERSLIRSTKTVRATMASVEYLIEKIPNLRVIHLVRDPRAVVLSRKHFHASVQSLYSRGDITKEAKIFCQNLAQDIVKRRQLEAKYPGSFMEVVYDTFVNDPLKYSQDIYAFMNVALTKLVIEWIDKNTKNLSILNGNTNFLT